MAEPVLLITDHNIHGGSITPSGPRTLSVLSTPVALVGDTVICPNCPNNDGDPVVTTIISTTATKLSCHGVMVATINSVCGPPCGATFSTTNARLTSS